MTYCDKNFMRAVDFDGVSEVRNWHPFKTADEINAKNEYNDKLLVGLLQRIRRALLDLQLLHNKKCAIFYWSRILEHMTSDLELENSTPKQ